LKIGQAVGLVGICPVNIFYKVWTCLLCFYYTDSILAISIFSKTYFSYFLNLSTRFSLNDLDIASRFRAIGIPSATHGKPAKEHTEPNSRDNKQCYLDIRLHII